MGSLCLIGGLLGGGVALGQVDFKRVVAYSRVCHIGLGLALLLIGSVGAVNLSLTLLLGHGLVSAGLFLVVRVLGEWQGSRSVLIQRSS